MRIFVITVFCLALTSPAFAGLYKWVDKKTGKVHFSDSLKDVPMDQRNKKHIKKMKSSKGGHKTTPFTSAPAPKRKYLGAKKEGSSNGGSGVDKQRLNDLLRLNQKKHYNH